MNFILVLPNLAKYNIIKFNLIFHCLAMFIIKIMFNFIYIILKKISLNYYFEFKLY
jgi:hypothetical protein